MDNTLNITGAANYKSSVENVPAKEIEKRIRERIWPNNKDVNTSVNLNNLKKNTEIGRILRIICEETGKDANYVLRMEGKK